MSTGSEITGRTDQVSAARGLIRAVKPAYRGRADTEMHTIGLLYATLMVILFVPLLPFAVVIWAVWRVGRALRAFVGDDGSTGGESAGRRRRGRAL
ncbi:hypothetical protein ACFQE8_05310 [Salinirubellus sp. GCM10025818]|uniref:DUF7535 family protein n=1 Tax=Salinirubellus TaxID=2162630 RepID=UPI0030CCF92B